MEKIDIYGYDERIAKDFERLNKDKKVLRKNKDLIKEFIDFCYSERLSKARISRFIQCLHKISIWLKKDLRKVKKEDIIKVLKKIESNNFSPWTIQMYRVVVRRFFSWLGKVSLVNWIKLNIKPNETTFPEDLLSEEEVKILIEKCDNLRDKALISCLYESAGRPSEVLGMRIKEVSFDEYGALIILHGKTGARKIRVVNSAPYLASWIENHPLRNNRDAPLWILIGNVGKLEPMSYAALSKIIRKISKIAKLEKSITPYTFRHSRLTALAKVLTEQQLKVFAGWTQASRMASVYVHLSARDIDQAILGAYGIKKSEKEKLEESKLKPIECIRCKTTNEATNRFCKKCGLPLDLKAVVEIEEKRELYDELIAKALEDKKIRRMIVKKLINLGLRERLERLS